METKSASQQKIFLFSLVTFSVLLLIYLNYAFFKRDYVWIGVIQELITIPCLLAQPVLLFFAAKGFFNNGFRVQSYSFASIVLLIIAMSVTLGSFFVD